MYKDNAIYTFFILSKSLHVNLILFVFYCLLHVSCLYAILVEELLLCSTKYSWDEQEVFCMSVTLMDLTDQGQLHFLFFFFL